MFLCKEHSAASAGVNVLSPAVQMFLCLIHYIWYQFKWNKVKLYFLQKPLQPTVPPSIYQSDSWMVGLIVHLNPWMKMSPRLSSILAVGVTSVENEPGEFRVEGVELRGLKKNNFRFRVIKLKNILSHPAFYIV